MKHIKEYKVFESRGAFGRIADFIVGRKDIKEIEYNGTPHYNWNDYYKYKNGKIILSDYSIAQNFEPNTSQVLEFRKDNPDSVLLYGLYKYANTMFQGPIIKLDLFFKDLLPILESRDLDLLFVCFERDEDSRGHRYASIKLIEKDYIEGDGMPDDIKKEYITSIKTAMKKKANYYIENYNILQSRSTHQKMKYRTIHKENVWVLSPVPFITL